MTRVFVSTYQNIKEQSQAGRALLDFVLREYYDLDLSCLKELRGERGKPYFAGNPVYYNISHSSGVVVLALSDAPVGVDVEVKRKIRRKIGERFLGISTDDPLELLRAWTRRESYGKMTGEGFFFDCPQREHCFAEYPYPCGQDDFLITVCSPCGDFADAPVTVTLP